MEFIEENICDSCKFRDSDGNKKPCSVCIDWVDGYLEYQKYENMEVFECGKKEV